MLPFTAEQFFSSVLPLLSLCVTIIGWYVTARNQRKILEMQIQAERAKQVQQLIFSRRLEQLNAIRSWLEEGEQIWRIAQAQQGDQ